LWQLKNPGALDIQLAEIKAELKVKNQLYEKFELKNGAKSKGWLIFSIFFTNPGQSSNRIRDSN